MKRKMVKKLVLGKETLRELESSELTKPVGGEDTARTCITNLRSCASVYLTCCTQCC